MKHLYYALLIAAVFTGCQQNADRPAKPPPPPPTEFTGDGPDEDDKRARQEWIRRIHRAAPGTDWRKLESHNAMVHHRKRQGQPGEKTVETFAGGLLTGEWTERGSNTIAGSMFDIVQDPNDPNRLLAMSAGGAIWEIDYAEQAYRILNDDLYFNRDYLGLLPTATGGYNLIAYTDARPLFSADDGQTWSFATVTKNNAPVAPDDISSFFSPMVIGSVMYTTMNVDREWGLFISEDGGRTYRESVLPPPFVEGEGQVISHLYSPPGIDRLFLVMKQSGPEALVRLYENTATADTVRWSLLNEQALGANSSYRSQIAAAAQKDTAALRFYWQAAKKLFRSDDGGATFTELPELEKVPWRYASIYVRPSDPDFVAYGAVELWVSRDGGQTFEFPNRWFEYGDDPLKFLHADIMRLKEIRDPEGELQVLVSNHGGINQLNERDGYWYSIAPEGLNNAQYYDVRTNPLDDRVFYAGSQDQGLQVFDQSVETGDILGGYKWITGDYGHLEFSKGGDAFWAAYPRGLFFVQYDWEPALIDYTNWARFELDSPDEFIWISPTMAPPSTDGKNSIYMAGGSADEAREGSYVVKLTLDENFFSPTRGEVIAEDLPFNFQDDAGQITALSYSPANPDIFYVATEFGLFYTSRDRGRTWERSVSFVPDGWYLYGQAIHASGIDENEVWLGGSGYSNEPVWRSLDGGRTFEPASEGLPPTIIHGMAANPTESVIFAATEAGPFAYLAAEERWFPLTGEFAPTMRYYSVEYLPEQGIARFGTYGRGAWDFGVEQLVSASRPDPAPAPAPIALYPNPARNSVAVEGLAEAYRIYDLSGRELLRTAAAGGNATLNVGALPAGIYFVQPLDAAGRPEGFGQRLVVE